MHIFLYKTFFYIDNFLDIDTIDRRFGKFRTPHLTGFKSLFIIYYFLHHLPIMSVCPPSHDVPAAGLRVVLRPAGGAQRAVLVPVRGGHEHGEHR